MGTEEIDTIIPLLDELRAQGMKLNGPLPADTLFQLSVVSFGAFAADIINSEQAQGREAIGTVSVGAVASSPMDMHEMLNKKAQEEGASSYRIIEARTGDHWHATAELYK